MKVGEQQHIYPTDRDIDPGKPDGGATPGVNEQLLIASLDQRARSETILARNRRPLPSKVTVKSLTRVIRVFGFRNP
jgi:hypothetical protein